MENNRWDMLEWLGPDASACVLTCLDDPADMARASSVSRSWRNFVISNELVKALALRLCPEISNFTGVELLSNKQTNSTEPSSSNSAEYQIQEEQHRVYSFLSRQIVKLRNSGKDCTLRCIGASSTDNFPEESIENTLVLSDRVNWRPSYWSSGGQSDQNAPECLVYQLSSDLYLLEEIRIQPFRAFFQDDNPIYSSKNVRFKMGYSKLKSCEMDEEQLTGDDNYIWTYISPEYPMAQESTLQSFKLPRPILCIGGILKIELLGRVQTQFIDGLYYICVCHVQVIGCPISSQSSIATSSQTESQITLQYFPKALDQSESATPADALSTGRWQSFTDRIRQIGPNVILNTLFGGPVQFAQVEGYEDDDDYDDVDASEEEVEIEG